MTSQQILKADLLDILFENRNKAYGAYEIRKTYPKNLMKALGIMLLSVIALSVYVMSQPHKTLVRVTTINLTDETKLDNIKEEKKIVEPPKETRTVAAQPPTQPDFSNIVLVDDDPNPPVRDQTDTATTVPGSDPSPGTGDGRDFVQGTTDTVTRIVTTHVDPVEPHEPVIRDFAEVQPEFPGGEQAWINYLQRMLRVPDDMEPGDRKTVRVKFVVNVNGEVTDAVIISSAGSVFDKEVLRVIGRMPKWKPGRQNGENVAVYFTQPVTFATVEE